MLAFQLYQLQQLDSKGASLEKRIAELEALLADESEVRSAEQRLQDAKAAFARAQHALREAEANSQAVASKIARTEETMYSGRVRNPRELQALQEEVAALKRRLEKLEDAQLEAMLALEEATQSLRTAEENFQAVKTKRNSQEARWQGELTDLRERLARLHERRGALASAIPNKVLETYEKLRTSRYGLAVATVSEGTCDACGAPLPPSTLQAAKSPNSLAFCPTCKRILYVP